MVLSEQLKSLAISLTFEDKMQLMLDMIAYQERKVINGVMQIRGRKAMR